MTIQMAITVNAYLDPSGEPTCARNFETGDVCVFYRASHWGCHETCVFAKDEGKCMEPLKRRRGGEGSLIPLSRCPIWPQNTPETQ